MAHKVLSKDMAELVSALKLDERCSNTTLDNEYHKMLSAAHVLAMNAINLLDVVDHARIKHPHVNTYLEASRFGSHAAHHVNLIFAMLLLEPGTFHKNTELHFSHPIQVLHPIVQTARKSRLPLL
ncbi:hypothetical protein DAPPUDRAFT_328654 [Daphnia pulex]|uniref:Focal AT domain-containing protein n=1 Tax=Daphnia pulex TaxID=6669 RepID=E9HED1_DAPPU|nr:hypothetical protein DAPPUDRAFT_328654 [Daphnia pulex]|eukprot:EFX69924.1 hypothetical protein DAPPUDRAFT_328654 [Daphnia pulex]